MPIDQGVAGEQVEGEEDDILSSSRRLMMESRWGEFELGCGHWAWRVKSEGEGIYDKNTYSVSTKSPI